MGSKKSIFERFKLIEKVNDSSLSTQEPSAEGSAASITHEITKDKTDETAVSAENTQGGVKEQMDDNSITIESAKYNLNEVLDINEIYTLFNLQCDELKSIFIIEDFMKALPDNLPTEVRLKSVLNIMSASKMNLSDLINDGQTRINSLEKFNKDFSKEVEDTVIGFQTEIKSLEDQILKLKASIDNLDCLKAEQNSIVNYNLQKIQNIIEFINQ